MTARQIVNNALKLLGYTDANGNSELPQRILNKAVPLINVIYSELARIESVLDFEPIKTLNDEIKLTERILSEIMPAGVAMLIAASEEDGVSEALWAEIYNRKKVTLSRFEERQDSIPRSFDL